MGLTSARRALVGVLCATVAGLVVVPAGDASSRGDGSAAFAASPAQARSALEPGGVAAWAGPSIVRPAQRQRFVSGWVIVGFRSGLPAATRRRIERAVGARGVRNLTPPAGHSGAARRLHARLGAVLDLRVARGSVRRVVAMLRARRRWVRYAEPDYVLEASAAIVPNDPGFALQWGSLNTGQLVNGITGTAGADDGAARAWAISTGSPSVVIGEVDSGIDYTHPDLAGNVWSNPGGIGGCPAGTHGYNVLSSTCDPMDDDTSYGGHGTHVAGIMGATGNNSTGVAGMNWHTTLLPVKWLNSQAWGDTSSLISALNWELQAKQSGVNIQVINDSATFEGDSYSQALSDEIDTLGANGILFVTAAGNSGENNDNPSYTRYPCGYDRPTEICVTASNQSDTLPSWANYGPSTVDLAAPGANIYSTLRNDTYGYIDGGSMAAAQVSGAAALILSVQQMSPTALKADILDHVDPLPALSGLVRTGGRLDVCAAMPGCQSPVSGSPPANTALPVVSGVAQTGQVLSASTGSWSGSPTGYAYSWSRCGSSGCAPISGASGSTYTVVSGDVGSTLEVTVTASNAVGSASATSAPTAAVTAPPQTLGYTSVGSYSDWFSPNRKRVNAYSLTAAGVVSKLSLYLAPTGAQSGQADIEGVIYADSNGSPGALLGETSQLVYSAGTNAGWYDLPFATPVSVAAGTYWIGVLTGGNNGVAGFRYTNVSRSRDWNSNSYSAGPSSPFGSYSTDSERMSLYATYSVGPPPPPTAPANTALPVVSGVAQTGQVLSASTGSWSGSPTGYAYSWSRCGSSGCAPISGASGSTYTVVSGDVGSTLEVTVTASNAVGSASATSAPTAAVTAPPQTLGYTSVGSYSDWFAANRKRVNAYSLAAPSSVTKLRLYLQPAGGTGTADIEGVIYADAGGSPGALIAQTSQLAYTSSETSGWYDLTFSSPVSLATGTYWLGVLTGGSSGVAGFRYASVSGSRDYNANTYSNGPSNPFGSFSTDSEEMSLYGTLG